MRKTLRNEYADYFSNIDLDIDLEGDAEDLLFYLYVPNSQRTAWDALDDAAVKRFISYIAQDIADAYEDAYITGYALDAKSNKKLATYTLNSKGKTSFTRY